MKEIRGNLWIVHADVRVITTNGAVKRTGECVMGRGCALEATRRYPGIALVLGNYIREHGNRCFRLRPDLASFPVKHVWSQPADIDLIVKSCGEISLMADKFGWHNIVLPRPGCGNGRLLWKDVSKVVIDLLDDRFSVITF